MHVYRLLYLSRNAAVQIFGKVRSSGCRWRYKDAGKKIFDVKIGTLQIFNGVPLFLPRVFKKAKIGEMPKIELAPRRLTFDDEDMIE